MTPKATTAITVSTGLPVKRSPNSQTLSTMAASGSTMASSGWDTLSGPTCSAACCSTVPTAVAAANAYTGQLVSIATGPDTVSVSVAVFRNTASMAQVIAAAAASTAARRTGGPCKPSSARPAMIPPNTTPAVSHCAACGAGWPPVGSAAARNTASAPATVSTEAQAAGRTCWWIHTRRSTITKISSVISSGWTTDSGPLFSAPACRMYEPTPAAAPSSHIGCRIR